MKIVHYVNQFFAGIGGEDAAGSEPGVRPEPVGPGRRLADLLAPEHEVVATVWCGDDHAAQDPDAVEQCLALARDAGAELLVAGPAFTSGRYGLACGRLVAAATRDDLPAIAAMHPDNPGLDEAGAAPVVESEPVARGMGPSLDRLAAAVRVLARGEQLGPDEGRISKLPRRNRLADRSAAERAVDLLCRRIGGDRTASEIPLPRFDQVTPAAPVTDLGDALVALVTEGALVPTGNPDGLESARATRWLRYPVDGGDGLSRDAYSCIHGGFSTQWANADPHRILPLDAARELVDEGRIGRLHSSYLVTAGNGMPVPTARRFGVEWAAELRRAGVQAAIFTST